MIAFHRGEYDTAIGYYEESLAVHQELGDERGVASELCNLGEILWYKGDLERAVDLLEQGLAVLRTLGGKRMIAFVNNMLGHVYLDLGEHERAETLYREALLLVRDIEDKIGMAYSIESFARTAAVHECNQRALILAGAAAALRQTIAIPLSPVEQRSLDRYVDPAREALGDDAAGEALAEGCAMSIEEAVRYALD
jgi:tetratricopeptide (TPR) repeat protein